MTPAAAARADIDDLVRNHVEALARRYESALAACGFDAALVLAGSRRWLTRDDQAYPFHPDPYFAQWLPLADAADSAVEFVPGRKPRLLHVSESDFWHEPAHTLEAPWTRHFEIELVSPRAIAQRLERRTASTAVIGRAPALAAADRADDARLLAELDYTRAVKTPYEIACMAEANASAARGHAAVAAAFEEGLSEFDLHLRYARATRLADTELPYATIIGINEHAATLHYQNRRRTPPPELRSLLIDAGATARGYAADVSRTYARRAGAFAGLIESIEGMQQTLCREARAGVDFVELNERAHVLLAGVLAEQGLLACSAEAAYEGGITTTFLPHGLGHLLGIQVHDVGGRLADRSGAERAPPARHPFLRLTRRLEPGFVVTIEPGIYFIPALLEALRGRERTAVNWLRVESLVPFGGVRIEDNVVVESAGARNLTRAAFATLQTQ